MTWLHNVVGETQFTPLIELQIGVSTERLEKAWAQIETVAGQEQRHGKADSTKHEDGLRNFDVDQSSRRARKRAPYDSSHLRSP